MCGSCSGFGANHRGLSFLPLTVPLLVLAPRAGRIRELRLLMRL